LGSFGFQLYLPAGLGRGEGLQESDRSVRVLIRV
jgi:hypothetical protein